MWSTIPNLQSRRALAAIVAAASGIAALTVSLASLPTYLKGMGDTDDAIRLELVRELLGGKGWSHPELLRMQPPDGALMHWSRLVDGGIAATDLLFRLVLPAAQAETAARCVWPLLWLPLAVLSVCLIARRLSGSAGLLAAGVLAAMSLPAFEPFRPGRIDHHNVQLAMGLIGSAAAIAGRERWQAGAVAGIAAALGLAVGLEALAFHGLIGVYFALKPTLRREAAAQARAYGFALAGAAILAYLVQTPPRLWTVSVCDTMGANLVALLALAGLGVAGASLLPRRGLLQPLAAATGGAAALAVYVAMHPSCLHGPMGDTPLRIQAYIDYMAEMRPFWAVWPTQPWMVGFVVGPALALLALPFVLAREGRVRQPEWLLLTLLLTGSFALALLHIRLSLYPDWLSMPILATALADVAGRWRRLLVPTILAAALVSPAPLSAAVIGLRAAAGGSKDLAAISQGEQEEAKSSCTGHLSYARLSRLPAGLVLADMDLTPFILTETPHSVLAGPYHRLIRGLDETFTAFAADPKQAEGYVRALHVAYVVDCPGNVQKYDHVKAGPRGLMAALDRRAPPPWLEPLSRPNEAVQIYKVR